MVGAPTFSWYTYIDVECTPLTDEQIESIHSTIECILRCKILELSSDQTVWAN